MPGLRKDKKAHWGLLSSYCGPGGSGIPQHKLDEICKEHDADYQVILEAGTNPYWKHNWADRKFLASIAALAPDGARESAVLHGAKAFFKLKRHLAPQGTSEMKHLRRIDEKNTLHALRRNIEEETKEIDPDLPDVEELDAQDEYDEEEYAAGLVQGVFDDVQEMETDDLYKDQAKPHGEVRKRLRFDSDASDNPSLPKRQDTTQVFPDRVHPNQQWNWGRMSNAPTTIDNDGDDNMDGVAQAALGASDNSAQTNKNQVTPIAKIPPRMPWKNTEQAILEYHGSCSVNKLVKLGDSGNTLKICMNTYYQPFRNSSTASDQVDWQQAVAGISRQVVGRYTCMPGQNSSLIEALYHRELQPFDDPLFNVVGTPYTLQAPAGATYYNNHYGAYTVTKCEWMLYVEFPFHAMHSSYSTDNSPSAAQVQAAFSSSAPWERMPQCKTAARVFTHYIMSGDTITPVNPPLNASVGEMERWFNVYENKISVPPNGTQVIRGVWYPGKVKHNPLNDGDIQVWTPVGTSPASSHLEELVIQFKEQSNSNAATSFFINVNVHINVKWHIQFKEPITGIQYPRGSQTNPTGTAVNSRVLQSEPSKPV